MNKRCFDELLVLAKAPAVREEGIWEKAEAVTEIVERNLWEIHYCSRREFAEDINH